jgi:hypothetical protein
MCIRHCRTCQFGITATLTSFQKCARDIELSDCLEQAFGKLATNIIVMAAYIIREGNAMDGIDDWQRRNYFSGVGELLTSQSTSRIFANITLERRMKF